MRWQLTFHDFEFVLGTQKDGNGHHIPDFVFDKTGTELGLVVETVEETRQAKVKFAELVRLMVREELKLVNLSEA